MARDHRSCDEHDAAEDDRGPASAISSDGMSAARALAQQETCCCHHGHGGRDSQPNGGHCQRWYHTYVDKTTIYLPTELKAAIKRVARQRGVSEAEVIRESIRDAVGDDRPRPRGGLFASGAPIAREDEEHLTGFGER